MINPVSETTMTSSNPKPQPQGNIPVKKSEDIYAVRYADSFIKHSAESVPMLTGMTLVWSFIDKSRGISFNKALTNNIKTFFLPVLLVTSAITAFLENRKIN